ncbi:MAG: redoxin family protein [Bdellovibrionales bacterium]|nr:redoxin family protein [Bdellovibrionales bacterium]
MMKKFWIASGLMLLFINFEASAAQISPGSWRFTLQTTHAQIPFVVDFKYKNKKLTGILRNGKESIPLTDIKYEKKEISIPLQTYELSLELTQQDKNTLIGHLVRHNKNPIKKTPIVGLFGPKTRFDEPKEKPSINLTGKWSLVMEDEQNQKSPGLGMFKQKGNKFSGSILTPTGDYRYLDGFVEGNRFRAASFDGVYNYTLEGSLKDGTMAAALLSSSKTKISGNLDLKAALPDPYKLTELKELSFILPDLKGQSVSLNHPKFKNKPVIVQFFGSWCPNCMDEMNYLIYWYNQNSKRGVEIIALAFERSLSPEDATRQLQKVSKKMKVPYTILQAGSTAEDKPAEKIKGLKNFISFPTTIFLNKKHQVVKVHAGFNGPSTGEYYKKWIKEFNDTVEGLLK